MTSFLAILAGTPIPRNIDPQEHLRYFSWSDFVFACLLYSVFVFRDEISKNGLRIFSKHKNARSISQVLTYHFAFLIILFCLMRTFNFIVPDLPYWMTDTFNAGRGARLSIADLLFAAIAGVMVHRERKWQMVGSRHDRTLRPE